MEEREKLFLLFERQTFLFPYFPATQFLEQKAQSANTLSRQHISKHVVARIDTHLLALHVPVPDPLAELRPPILEHIRLRVFDTLAVAKAALSACGGDHVNRVKIDFQPLAWLCGDLQLRAPGTSVALLLQPARVNIYTEITGLLFLLSFLFFFSLLSFFPSLPLTFPAQSFISPPSVPRTSVSTFLFARRQNFSFFFFPLPPLFLFSISSSGKTRTQVGNHFQGKPRDSSWTAWENMEIFLGLWSGNFDAQLNFHRVREYGGARGKRGGGLCVYTEERRSPVFKWRN